MDDILRLDMLALGCAIGAVGLLATVLLITLVNRVTGRTRLTFRDEASREGDRQ